MARLTGAEFCERYEITSIHGRVYTRAMLRAYVFKRYGYVLRLCGWADRVDARLDDAAWMRKRRGCVPEAIARDIWNDD